MATNKHATIRYHALDRCFSNFGRKYFIEDLVNACNESIYEFAGIEDGVKRRQVFDDINFMESEQGWSIPLNRIKDGKKIYYRYTDKDFSIKKLAINNDEAQQLKETLSILTRFKGMPQFEWMEEMLIRIETTFNLKGYNNFVVAFEQNPYLKGLHHFTELFNAIQYKRVLNIEYKGYRQVKSDKLTIHPYFLKQYNNRWFLFGYNDNLKKISNLAIDRILELKETNQLFIDNNSINFEEYFDDVIGVTVNEDKITSKVIIEISKDLWPYIESKPIHGSQKIISKSIDYIVIELSVKINYELVSMIFSFGDKVKVLEPQELINEVKEKLNAMVKSYF